MTLFVVASQSDVFAGKGVDQCIGGVYLSRCLRSSIWASIISISDSRYWTRSLRPVWRLVSIGINSGVYEHVRWGVLTFGPCLFDHFLELVLLVFEGVSRGMVPPPREHSEMRSQ
jgi:hypothetical protein